MWDEEIWKKIEAEIDRREEDAFAISDWEAAHPEIGGEEFGAVELHTEFLKDCGFEVKSPAFGLATAYHGTLDGKAHGRRVALITELDALAGLGHGCGHNVHGAMSILAAAGLAPFMREINGRLEVYGTPAEETWGGKINMANSGAFDGLDFAMMIHCNGGRSIIPYGALACQGFEFVFEGKPSHASGAPWEGQNALNAIRILFDALDMWRQHLRPEIRIHGIITEGGAAPNIVPERAVARIEFRAPDQEMENDLIAKALDCARGAALCTGTKVSWSNFEGSFDAMKKNNAAYEMVQKIYESFGVPISAPIPPGGSTDMGNVSQRCPAIQPVLDISDGVKVSTHTREFLALCVSPNVHPRITLGAKILAKSMLTVLLNDNTAAKIHSDFEAGAEN